MAQIYGTSKAWQEIAAKLDAAQLKANHPRDINVLLEDSTREYEEQMGQALNALADEIILLEQDVNKQKEQIEKEMAVYSEKFSLDIEQAEVTLDLYQHERSIFNSIHNFLKSRRERIKLTGLRKTIQDYQNEIEKPLRAKENELGQMKAHKEQLAREQCGQLGAKIEILRDLSGSTELANAQAELEMLEYLQSLPDHVHVINHLNLSVDRGFRFDGKWLINGQINHLVVSPAGLFAIQVKNWNKQSTKKPSGAKLGEEINDAAQLCYLLVKPKFPNITVRGVLAYRGHMPENEKTGFVKVLQLQEVCGYISWFKEHTLDDERVRELVIFLQQLNHQEITVE